MSTSLSTPADKPLTIKPVATPGAVLVFVNQPAHGKLTFGLSPDQLVYTPAAGFAGQDRFSIAIGDGRGGNTLQEIAVTVQANRRPQALGDRVSTAHATSVLIDVLANDTDPDGHDFALDSVAAPKNGSARIEGRKIRYTPRAGFSGQDSFTYRLLDTGGAYETGSITVTVAKALATTPPKSPPVSPPPSPPPPSPPPVVDRLKQAYNGGFLGCTVHAEAVGNHRYGYRRPAAFRFAAEYSGTVRTVRWVNRRDTGTGSAHVGYSIGNGGRIRIELRNNGPDNMPSKKVLGRTGVLTAASLPFYAEVPFAGAMPTLKEGRVYHLVFVQLDSSGKNEISVNMLHTKKPVTIGGNGRMGPFHGDLLAFLASTNNEQTWYVREDRCPIFVLTYTDGVACGQGWLYSHDSCAKPIGGPNMARQRFTIGDRDLLARGVWTRLRRQGRPTDLIISLRQGDDLVGTIEVPPDKIVPGTMHDQAAPWQLHLFKTPQTLRAHKLYDLGLEANDGNFFAHGVQRGSGFGFKDRNMARIGSGHAEYSPDRGRTWRGWNYASAVQGVAPHTDIDLPLAFLLT